MPFSWSFWTLHQSVLGLTLALLAAMLAPHSAVFGDGAIFLGILLAVQFWTLWQRTEGTRVLADFITVSRVALASAALGTSVLIPLAQGGPWIFAFATLAALSDRLDGVVARLRGPTEFGAKLDMEVDAYLILVLALIVRQNYELEPVFLTVGALRYAWVLLTHGLEPLESSRIGGVRARVLYAVALTAQVGALWPGLEPIQRTMLCTLSTLALVTSFGTDLWKLAARYSRASA